MTEERTDLERQLRDIQKWEKAQQRVMFWQTFTRLPFQLLDKLTPQFIQRKIGLILDETGTFIQSGGQYLTSEKRIMKKFQKRLPHGTYQTLHDIRNAPLAVMDEIAEGIARTSVKAATVQGAATGVGGVFTLAADIPAMLGLSLKTLQDIAVAYGFDPKDKKERVFIVKLLQLASSDVIGKKRSCKIYGNMIKTTAPISASPRKSKAGGKSFTATAIRSPRKNCCKWFRPQASSSARPPTVQL